MVVNPFRDQSQEPVAHPYCKEHVIVEKVSPSDNYFRASALVYDGSSYESGMDALDEIKIFGKKGSGEDDDDYTEDEASDYGASVVPNQKQRREWRGSVDTKKFDYVKTSDRARDNKGKLRVRRKKEEGDPKTAKRGIDPERLMNGDGDLVTIVKMRLMYDALKYNFKIKEGVETDK